MIDAFLVLKTADGSSTVEGESSDSKFPKAIEIRDFSFGDKAELEMKPQAPEDDKEQQDKDKQERMLQEMLAKQRAGGQNLNGHPAPPRPPKPPGGRPMTLADLKANVSGLNGQFDKDNEGVAGRRLQFSILKDVDAASADLFQAACATAIKEQTDDNRKIGEFASAEVVLRKMFGDAPAPYFTCTFKKVVITSYNIAFDSSRSHLYENVTFLFEEYKVEYQAQAEGGTKAAANPIKEGTLAHPKK